MERPKLPSFDIKFSLKSLIIICGIVIVITALVTYLAITGIYGSRQYLLDAKKYIELEETIAKNYIGETDKDEMFNAAASAMVSSIGDKWSYYLSPEKYEAYKLSTANEYEGVGISIKSDTGGEILISAVVENTPASRAGLCIGDEIISVDGEPVKGLSVDEAGELIRSKMNKDFTLTVKNGDGDEVSCTLACEVIYSNPVSSELLEKHIGYIKIANFEAGASENTIKAIENLITAGADSFIFDVRDDPGGLVRELVSLLDYILPEGDLFISIDKAGNEDVKTSDKISLVNKMVVLINGNTYSAAEFFAAALQEYNWATVVGEQTTGKARSQVTIELSDGAALHISTHKYLTPNRVDLAEAGGVTPDITPKNESTDPDAESTDYVLAAAVELLQ